LDYEWLYVMDISCDTKYSSYIPSGVGSVDWCHWHGGLWEEFSAGSHHSRDEENTWTSQTELT